MDAARCAAALAVIACLAFASPAAAVSTPQRGIYLDCKGDFAYCEPHIARLLNVGVSQFIIPTGGDGAQISSFIAARGGGIWWSTPCCDESAPATHAVLPGTIGFYIWDEPGLHRAGGEVKWWHDRVRALTGKPTIIVHWGCSAAQLRGALRPYVSAAEMHGNDCYPQTTGTSDTDSAGYVFGGLERLRQFARTVPQNDFAVLKAFSWSSDTPDLDPTGGTDKFPSRLEFRVMSSCARKANVRVLVYWGYDLWKDWITTAPAAYAARWNAFANGAYLDPYDPDAPCADVDGWEPTRRGSARRRARRVHQTRARQRFPRPHRKRNARSMSLDLRSL